LGGERGGLGEGGRGGLRDGAPDRVSWLLKRYNSKKKGGNKKREGLRRKEKTSEEEILKRNGTGKKGKSFRAQYSRSLCVSTPSE